ncbi:hypothetical protein J7T55_002710 [Diaporthe amygdali]|uniref:uncharacterized protein n=1 Tax=Phomopsis amygdali TaxID=1214568 RepID=UPI0022FF3C6D|nr:uncharacterized protein J7T55_002710 [Diaporthe amygdali]KAJ0122198.1 hypothetical protein J7T55_002710 [Diaporthe amygdali]
MRRPRAPPTNAAVFMETNDPVRGTLGGPASVYIEGLGRLGSTAEARTQDKINVEMWKEADEEINQLFALIVQVRAKMDRKSSSTQQQQTSLNLRQCTWEQVMGEVQSLATRWSTSPKKSSKMMIYLEKLGQNSDAFKSWLELLPAGDYGSSICGIFTIAVGAAGAFSKVEAIILETLAEIPEVLDDAKRYIEIYGKYRDQLLEKKTFELYMSILTALKHVMQFFVDSSWSKVYQPILKQSSYKSELLESCKDIKLRASRVKNEANICMQRRIVELNQAIHLQHDVLGESSGKMDQTLAILKNLYYKLFLSSEARFLPIFGQQDYIVQDIQATKNKKPVEDNREHTEMCLRLGAALDEAGRARAAALVDNLTFKNFMTETASSSALLINGNEDLSSAEGVSPLSLVAARLAQISEQNETTQGLTLRYFCAEHSHYGREHQNLSPAATMMASLTGQLVSHMLSRSVAVDLSFLEPENWAVLEENNLKVICTVFFELVKQLPPNTILLCILDEVGLYETGVPKRDADTVVRRLVRLVEASDEIVFKLLVTCRGRALGIGQYFTRHTLDLDEEVEADDSSTWKIASIGSKT